MSTGAAGVSRVARPPRPDLEAFDGVLDSAFFGTSFPFNNWQRGARGLLAAYESLAYEDFLEDKGLPIRGNASGLKFGLQHALEHQRRKHSPPQLDLDESTSSKAELTAAFELLRLGDQYHDGVCTLVSAFAGYTTSECIDSRTLKLTGPPPDIEYEALDHVLDELAQRETDAAAIRRSASAPITLGRPFDKSILLPGNVLSLPDDKAALTALIKAQEGTTPDTIPDDWTWRDIQGDVLKSILTCLKQYALFRIIQACRGLRQFGFRRVPLNNLLRTESRDSLVGWIAGKDQTARNVAESVIGYLSFGRNTHSPDPALQPLFHMGHNEVVLPLHLVSSSRIQRNFLTLAARVDEPAFGKASDVFARDMVERVRRTFVPKKAWIAYPRVRIPGWHQEGDIDVLVLAPEERRGLLLELKWNIETADMKEIVNRVATAADAASRVSARLRAATKVMDALLSQLGLPNNNASDWQLTGVIVFSNFNSGVQNGIPVCSEGILTEAIPRSNTLKALSDWCHDQPYRPRMGKDLGVQVYRSSIGTVSFEWQEFVVDVKAAKERFVNSLGELPSRR